MTRPTSSAGQSYPTVLGYQIVEPLGGGGFSRVFRAVNPNATTHQQAAVKVVSYAPSTTRQPVDRRALQKEVQIHSILKHENVLAFLGSVEYAGSTQGTHVPGLYILLELGAGGDLFDKIAPDVGVDEDLAHFYLVQLIAGLVYIHGQGVAHRDIKPENMLLDAQGNLKIADFGLCSVYKYKGRERTLHGMCGSLPYIAPEMNGTPYHGEPVDIWSAGVVLFALLVGNTPWDEPTSRSPEYLAYRTGALLRTDPWTRIPADALSLLRRMLHPDPQKRSSLEQIKRHRWFTRPNALLSAGKCTDPVTLAERLLQGLFVSGDMQLALHTDGQRAAVPENVSLSQPEALPRRPLALADGDVAPSSTAQPAVGGGRTSFGFASQLAPTQGDDFTQALTYMTQSAAPIPAGMLQLTRFFSASEPAALVSAISSALDALKAQFSVQPLGDSADLIDAYDMMGDDAPVTESASASASASASTANVGSRGTRIRVSMTDRRKCALKGEVRIEKLHSHPSEAHSADAVSSFILFRRSKGSPLEWRRLFRDICRDANVRPLIARTT
ncbi:non-specific serine/threonine protein kinase [Malassezia cuniculi]|uniref:Non-specific serine/threonine protein kinase n=1 Tax=Malassezia cuniculi TaxID=948313 RepID=A0AAF0EQZ8_9BASI|nr:non-specific serine/threonine protein kinase [Malassezia cuniculi]